MENSIKIFKHIPPWLDLGVMPQRLKFNTNLRRVFQSSALQQNKNNWRNTIIKAMGSSELVEWIFDRDKSVEIYLKTAS